MIYLILASFVSFSTTVILIPARVHAATKQGRAPLKAARALAVREQHLGCLQALSRAYLTNAPYAASSARLRLLLLLSTVPALTMGLVEDSRSA
jgi:hypothetical protein